MSKLRALATTLVAATAAAGLLAGAPVRAQDYVPPDWKLNLAPVDVNDPADLGTSRERFFHSTRYTGTFADPSIALIGDTYYATATNTDGVTLPLMRSDDLVDFFPRPALGVGENPSTWSQFNDAMPTIPAWAATIPEGARVRMSAWAPSAVTPVGGRYVVAYSAAVRFRPVRKSCLSVATATDPLGPYTDTRSTPLYCFPRSRFGAIDPDIHVDRDNRAWLLWKDEGILGGRPPTLVVRKLNKSLTGFAQRSRKTPLLSLSAPWEGAVIENPSMIRFRGRTYLFYSANDYASDRYAVGYALCRSVEGPCTKITERRPLISSTPALAGPGGAHAFRDRDGAFRIAYAAWNATGGPVGTAPNTRRLHVARVEPQRGTGRLTLVEHDANGPATGQ